MSPIIITTWKFGVAAAETGIQLLIEGSNALDAIEAAANVTELDPAVNSVGYGGLPNADGVVELDAAIMDGRTHGAGAVGSVTGIRRPISLARRVMERSGHTMLVGANAVRFALAEGFREEELSTPESTRRYAEWLEAHNRADVAHFDLGPINTREQEPTRTPNDDVETRTFDTIGLCALDSQGNLAAGCTTSGMAWKRPGRVGDSPIIGSGLYLDNEVGAAATTGHGDEIMKACVSFRVVSLMEQGRTPQEACEEALRYLLRKRPPETHDHYGAAVIALRRDGEYGGAATLSGFRAPDRLWHWAVGTPTAVSLHEGSYVTPDSRVSALHSPPQHPK